MRIISVIHPSRQRPELAFKAAKLWKNNCVTDRVEYILSIDESDPRIEDYRRLFSLPDVGLVKILVSPNKSCMEAVNAGAKAASGDILLVNSDDFACEPGWDQALLTALEGKSDFCVKTDDGCQPWIMTMPLMDRTFYNRFGYIYNPAYGHLFADTEMTHVSDLLNTTIKLPLVFRHEHYTTGAVAADELNVRNNASWEQGEALYLKRVKENFGLKDFPGVLRCQPDHIEFFRRKGIDIVNYNKQA